MRTRPTACASTSPRPPGTERPAVLFPNSADDALVVHDRGETFADVTEGSGGIWERLRYDWSDLSHVVLKTVDSTVWGGRSGHTYTFSKQADGTTVVRAEVVREGKNLKGRLLGLTLGLVGGKVLGARQDGEGDRGEGPQQLGKGALGPPDRRELT